MLSAHNMTFQTENMIQVRDSSITNSLHVPILLCSSDYRKFLKQQQKKNSMITDYSYNEGVCTSPSPPPDILKGIP